MDSSVGDGKEENEGEAAAEAEVAKKKRLTSILFSRVAPVIVTGDDHGSVDVYRVYGIGQGTESFSRMQNIERLKASIVPFCFSCVCAVLFLLRVSELWVGRDW